MGKKWEVIIKDKLKIFLFMTMLFSFSLTKVAEIETEYLSHLIKNQFLGLKVLFVISLLTSMLIKVSLKIKCLELKVIIISILLFCITQQEIYIYSMCFYLVMQNIDERKMVKTYFYVSLFCFCLIIILNYFGIRFSSERIFKRLSNGEIRYDLGFGNPNRVFLAFNSVILPYVYLKFDRWKLKNSLLLIFVVVVLYKLTLSRTGLILNVVLILLISTFKIISFEKIKFFLKGLFDIMFFYSLLGGLLLYKVSFFNLLSSNRLKFWNYYLTEEKVYLNFLGLLRKGIENVMGYPLDNGYIYTLVFGGIISFYVFRKLYNSEIKKAIIEDNKGYIIVLIYFFGYNLFESTMLNLNGNIVLMLALHTLGENRNENIGFNK